MDFLLAYNVITSKNLLPTWVDEYEPREWDEEDEARFAQALLVAGAEPPFEYETWMEDGYEETYATHESITRHEEWRNEVAIVLMLKFQHMWWYQWVMRRQKGSPEYRVRCHEIFAKTERLELVTFYTWLCKQRGEPWTDVLTLGP